MRTGVRSYGYRYGHTYWIYIWTMGSLLWLCICGALPSAYLRCLCAIRKYLSITPYKGGMVVHWVKYRSHGSSGCECVFHCWQYFFLLWLFINPLIPLADRIAKVAEMATDLFGLMIYFTCFFALRNQRFSLIKWKRVPYTETSRQSMSKSSSPFLWKNMVEFVAAEVENSPPRSCEKAMEVLYCSLSLQQFISIIGIDHEFCIMYNTPQTCCCIFQYHDQTCLCGRKRSRSCSGKLFKSSILYFSYLSAIYFIQTDIFNSKDRILFVSRCPLDWKMINWCCFTG